MKQLLFFSLMVFSSVSASAEETKSFASQIYFENVFCQGHCAGNKECDSIAFNCSITGANSDFSEPTHYVQLGAQAVCKQYQEFICNAQQRFGLVCNEHDIQQRDPIDCRAASRHFIKYLTEANFHTNSTSILSCDELVNCQGHDAETFLRVPTFNGDSPRCDASKHYSCYKEDGYAEYTRTANAIQIQAWEIGKKYACDHFDQSAFVKARNTDVCRNLNVGSKDSAPEWCLHQVKKSMEEVVSLVLMSCNNDTAYVSSLKQFFPPSVQPDSPDHSISRKNPPSVLPILASVGGGMIVGIVGVPLIVYYWKGINLLQYQTI